MTVHDMAVRIVASVKRGGNTFRELEEEIGPEAKGEWAIMPVPNTFLKAGVSETFIDAWYLALPNLKLHYSNKATAWFFHMWDGHPNLPVATRVRLQGYASKRWLPITFSYAQEREFEQNTKNLNAEQLAEAKAIRHEAQLPYRDRFERDMDKRAQKRLSQPEKEPAQ